MRNFCVVLVSVLVLLSGCNDNGEGSQKSVVESAEAETVKPADTFDTLESVKPVEPVKPAEVIEPNEPVKPIEALKPVETVKEVKTAGPEFFEAAWNGQIIAVNAAIDNGVDVNSLDRDKRSALMLASFDGHTDVVSLLIKNGADVNLSDSFGRTALMFAASGDNAETVKVLLENKANVNAADSEEHFTSLMFAAAEGRLEVVRLLLKNKADWKMVDVDGDTARKFAADNGHTDAVTLIDAHAALNVKQKAESVAEGSRPNILYIMIDDLGWMDLACQGAADYHTPNIDRLAQQGMRFTDAYAAAPVCSPTRAAAMTGLAPARLRITNHIPDRWSFYNGKSLGPGESVNQLDPGYTTIAERLKEAGYATAFIGKWHLSGTNWSDENRRYLPENQGFDINIGGNHQGGPGGNGSFFDPYDLPNLKGRKPGQYLPDRLAEEAIDFMKKQNSAGKPFFVCLWNYTVHWPVEAPESLYRKYADGEPNLHQKYQAMVEGMDIAVGKVLAAMDAMGVTDETLVVFTSDNGPFVGDNNDITTAKPLKGSKGYLSEGGIRVPLIIRWPGRVKPAALCSEPVVTMDFVPTFLDAAKVQYKAGQFDGETLVPLLRQSGKLSRDAVYFHFPHYAFHRDNRMGSVIRSGDYKLIRYHKTGEIELYNLADDIGETKNLAKTMPDVAARLNARLDSWLAETKAAMPRPLKDIAEDELYGKRK